MHASYGATIATHDTSSDIIILEAYCLEEQNKTSHTKKSTAQNH